MALVVFGYTTFPSWLFHRFTLTSQVQHDNELYFCDRRGRILSDKAELDETSTPSEKQGTAYQDGDDDIRPKEIANLN